MAALRNIHLGITTLLMLAITPIQADLQNRGILLEQDHFQPRQIDNCQQCGCNNAPSAAEVLRAVQVLLNNGILGLPQLQSQLITQLTPIISLAATGPRGPTGLTGATGAAGTSGGIGGLIGFSDFFALMPGDNAATIAVGAAVNFPQDGPTSGSIARLGPNTFNLPNIGTYEILFQVSVDEAGQLVVSLDGVELATTIAGRETGTSQIVGEALVTTTHTNSILSIVNRSFNTTALTITPIAGGARSVSAHLIIMQIQ